MRLYAGYRSSASYRVRLALQHKQVAFELVPVAVDSGETQSRAHRARNPLGQVPVLEVTVGGAQVCLAQSLAILEYLEECHPHPSLLPRDALLRARVRELAEMVNSGIQPLQNTAVLAKLRADYAGDADAWATFHIRKGLEALELRAKQTSGLFMVGNEPSMADVCLVPQLYNARRFGASVEGLPTLLAVEARCLALPRWNLAHPDAQPDAPKP